MKGRRRSSASVLWALIFHLILINIEHQLLSFIASTQRKISKRNVKKLLPCNEHVACIINKRRFQLLHLILIRVFCLQTFVTLTFLSSHELANDITTSLLDIYTQFGKNYMYLFILTIRKHRYTRLMA